MNKIRLQSLQAIIDKDLPPISNISNIIAFIYYEYSDLNWVGFYDCNNQDQECTLSFFQGRVACTRIPFGKGVVGACAQTHTMIVVDDVHQFAGHIACDSASNSEIVIPIFDTQHDLLCILDIDSTKKNRFDEETVQELIIISQWLESLFSSLNKTTFSWANQEDC